MSSQSRVELVPLTAFSVNLVVRHKVGGTDTEYNDGKGMTAEKFVTQVNLALEQINRGNVGKSLIRQFNTEFPQAQIQKIGSDVPKVFICYASTLAKAEATYAELKGSTPGGDLYKWKGIEDRFSMQGSITLTTKKAFSWTPQVAAGSQAVIFWDPNKAASGDGTGAGLGTARPAFLALAHELLHAHHALRGFRAFHEIKSRSILADGELASKDAEEVVVGLADFTEGDVTENKVRVEQSVLPASVVPGVGGAEDARYFAEDVFGADPSVGGYFLSLVQGPKPVAAGGGVGGAVGGAGAAGWAAKYSQGLWCPAWTPGLRAARQRMEANNFGGIMKSFRGGKCKVFDEDEVERSPGWLGAVAGKGTLWVLAHSGEWAQALHVGLSSSSDSGAAWRFSPDEIAKMLDEQGLDKGIGHVYLLRGYQDLGGGAGAAAAAAGAAGKGTLLPVASALADAMRRRDFHQVRVHEYEAPVDLRFWGGKVSLDLTRVTDRAGELVAKSADGAFGVAATDDERRTTSAEGGDPVEVSFGDENAPIEWNPLLEFTY